MKEIQMFTKLVSWYNDIKKFSFIRISKQTLALLRQLDHQISIQPTRSTASPRLYLVQEEYLHGGYILNSTVEGNRWLHEEWDNAAYTKREACEASLIPLEHPTAEDQLIEEGWREEGVKKECRVVTVCLTQQAADKFICTNRHNLINPTVYVISAWNNPEICFIVKMIKELTSLNA